MTNSDPRNGATLDEFKDIIASAKEESIDRARARAEAPPETVPVSRQRATLGGLIISLPILAILVVLNVWDVSMTDLFTPAPSPEIARQQAKAVLDGVVSGIERFQYDYHALPDELVQVGVPTQGTWTYSKLPGGLYRVVGRMYGQDVTFASTERKQFDEPQP
jgi:hypothetical protein